MSLGTVFIAKAQQLSISGGNDFSMVVCQDGRIMTWGNILTAAGVSTNVNIPTAVQLPNNNSGLKFSQADAGSGYHVLALDCERKVWAFGGNDYGQLGFQGAKSGIPTQVPGLNGQAQLNNVYYVSGGNTSSYALLLNGDLVSWGDNRSQQLGRPTTGEFDPLPNYVLTAPGVRLKDIIQVDAGDETVYALDINGNVYSWGTNTDNALGRTFTGNDTYATKVVLADGKTPLSGIVSISAGDKHCLALAEDRTVWSWGGDWGPGQLGQGTGNQTGHAYASQVLGLDGKTPLKGARYIAAGQASSMVVVGEQGNLLTFGANCLYIGENTQEEGGGNLGQGSTDCKATTEFPNYVIDCVTKSPITGISEVSDGDAVTFAITTDRQVYVMGSNIRGTLGLGDNENRGCATKLNMSLYSCGVPEPCPDPKLGPDIPVCSSADLNNIQLSVQKYPSYSYKWYYRPGAKSSFSEVTGATGNTLKPTQIGQYYVEVNITQSSCTKCEIGRDTINVGQGSNETFCKETSLTFSAPQPQLGIYRWWKSLDGTADSLAPRGITKTVSINDLTPEVTGADSTYSLYVEDLKSYNASLGVANNVNPTASYPLALNNPDRLSVFFDVNKRTTLNAVSLRFYNYNGAGNYDITLTVFNASTNAQVYSKMIGLDIPAGQPTGPIRFALGQTFDPGSYYIKMTAAENNMQIAFYDNKPELSYPIYSTGSLAGFFTLKGIVSRTDDASANVANSSPGIFNWEISGQNNCRLKVSWTRDCPCTKPTLDLKTTTGPSNFCIGVNSELVLSPNAQPTNPVNPSNYLYQWSKAGTILSSENGSTLKINSQTGVGNYLVRVGHTSLQRTKCFAEATLSIGVQPPISNNNLLTGNDSICLGNDAKQISGSTNVTGGLGAPKYQWIQSPNLTGPYTSSIKDTLVNYSPGKVQSSTYLRRVVTSGGVCKNDTSVAVLVFVDVTPDKGTLSTTRSTVCAGQSASITATPDQSGGKFKYQWQLSLDSLTWSDIQGATQAPYSPTPISQKTFYRRKVTSVKCFSFTDPIAFKVDQQVAQSSNTIAVNQIICKNSVPAPLTGSTEIKTTEGAIVPNPTYLWMSSLTGAAGSWVPAVGTNNGTSYNPPALDTTTYYIRAVSYGACFADTSTKVKVEIEPPLFAGEIALSLPTICKGTSPVITSVAPASGGTTPYAYKWQYFDGGVWNDIANSNTAGPLTTAPADTLGREYRRIVTSNAKCVQITSVKKLSVMGPMNPGSIKATDNSICAGQVPGIIKSTSEATGGTAGGTITYQWQSSVNEGPWQDIANETSLDYTPGALTENTRFRRRATNGPGQCDTVFATESIVQYKKLDPGSISAKTDEICVGTTLTIPAADPAVEGSPNKKYSWIVSQPPFSTWASVSGTEPSLTLTFATVGTFKYRRIVQDDCNGLGDTSRAEHLVLVAPKDTPIVNITTDLSPTFCNDKPLTVRVSTSRTGNNRKISWTYNNVTYFPTPEDSVFVISKETLVDGAVLTANVEVAPQYFCTNRNTKSKEVKTNIHRTILNNSILGSNYGTCEGTAFPEVQGSIPTGGISPTTYVWETAAAETGPWQVIQDSVRNSYKPTNTSATSYLRRKITSVGVCEVSTSNVFKLFVDKKVFKGQISPISAFQCDNDSIRYVRIKSDVPATGGTDSIAYSWEYSSDLTKGWSSLAYTTDSIKVPLLSLDPTELKTRFFFRRTARSAGGYCFAQADTIHADVCQKPKLTNIYPGISCANEEVIGAIITPPFDFSPNPTGGALVVSDYKIISKKAKGSISVDFVNNLYKYLPSKDSIGRDTVEFKICDLHTCATKHLYINILYKNTPFTVVKDFYSNYRNQTISNVGSILDNEPADVDGDTLYVYPAVVDFVVRRSIIKPDTIYRDSILAQPKHGTIVMEPNGTFTYEPEKEFMGMDTAFFWVCEHNSRPICNEYVCKIDTVVFEIKQYNIFVPKGFSPNGDNVNDYFVIKSEVPLPLRIAVYNRWGNLVYENNDYKNDWNGTANQGLVLGSGLPDGTYYLYYNVNNGEKDGFHYITLTR